MKPLVSILIPAYNAQDWILDCLQSAVGQSWEHKEIIVVDDGSTDDTLAMARRFESDSVIVFSQKNAGAAAARNKALSLSKGDYIQWLDADDLLGRDKVARQVEALSGRANPKILLSGAWGGFLSRYHRANFVPSSLWCDLSKTEWLIRKMSENLHMQTATWLVSRELTEAAGPWNTMLLGDDDGEYFCRVLLASEGVRFVPEARVYYRATGSGSLSYIGESRRKVDAHWRSMQLHIDYLRSLEDSERTHAAIIEYLRTWIGHFHPERSDIVDQAKALAEELGGRLEVPPLSWKYSWIEAAFGPRLAKRAQITLRRFKWDMLRRWDKAISHIDTPTWQSLEENRGHLGT